MRIRFGEITGESGKERIFALCECRLDSGTGIGNHTALGEMLRVQSLRRFGQIELDHLGWAGPDKHQHADIGASGEQASDHTIQLVVHVRHAGEVTLLDDRGCKARFREDHHTGCRLHQVRARPASNDQKERVLHLAMKPDDRRQTAENLALPPLPQG